MPKINTISCIKGNTNGNRLDKLELTDAKKSVRNAVEPLTTLDKRAKSKNLGYALSVRLAQCEHSPLVKSYWKTYWCATQIIKTGKKTISKYCKKRHCLVCNRIRTAEMIKGYLPALQQMKEPYFITLTAPTVPPEQLNSRLNEMNECWRVIMKRFQKKKIVIDGIRKTECTARPMNLYHPHYHLIVDGKKYGQMIINEWLKENETALKRSQDIRKADEKTIKELMKYFTKIFSKKKDKEGNYERTDTKRLDIIFQSMDGRRVYQPFGRIRKFKVSEDIDEIISEENNDIENISDGTYIWKQSIANWINLETAEILTNYEQTEDDKKLIQSII